jgi:hypothetical protein
MTASVFSVVSFLFSMTVFPFSITVSTSAAFGLRLRAFHASLHIVLGEECLDEVDKAVWVLPFLALLDAVSSFYIGSLGYPSQFYERGSFASLFLQSGLMYVYLYAVIYLFIMVGVAYVLWYIKNRELKPSRMLDKVFFLVLIGVVFHIYLKLTATLAVNFLLPSILNRRPNMFWLTVTIYVSSALGLGSYKRQAVLSWVKPHDKKEKNRS